MYVDLFAMAPFYPSLIPSPSQLSVAWFVYEEILGMRLLVHIHTVVYKKHYILLCMLYLRLTVSLQLCDIVLVFIEQVLHLLLVNLQFIK